MAATGNTFKNTTEKVADSVLESFESMRTTSKNVDTQLLEGMFGPETPTTCRFRRPTDFKSHQTDDGDISALTKSKLLTGSAIGRVQKMITVPLSINLVEQAIEAGDLDSKLKNMGTRIVTDLETTFAAYVARNTALLYGTPGTPATTWDDVAGAGAMMEATGVPMDDQWNYILNAFTQRKLASDTRNLGLPAPDDVQGAQRRAILTDNYAGMRVMTANTLSSYTTSAGADRAGTLTATPTATYDAASETMTQSLAVTAFEANLVVKAGETVQITGRNRLNLSTRLPVLDENANVVVWTATVTEEVTLDGSGAGILVVTGPAINETDGQYDTVDTAVTSGDVVTLLGPESKIIQPNLFFHKQAFGIGSVPMEKLYSTDSFAQTEDGMQLRVSRYADGDKNQNQIRVDFHPAFVTFNPFFAGQGFGTP